MTRYALPAVLAILVAACNPSPPEVNIGTTAGINVVSVAQPLAKRTTSLTIDWGPMGQPGQFAIADVLTYSAQKPTIAASAGWTLIRDNPHPVTTRQTLYWHVVGAADPSKQTWTFSERVDAQGAVLLLDNVDPTSPIDASSGNVGGGNRLTAKSLTTTNDGDLILAFFATDFGPGGLGVSMPSDVGTVAARGCGPSSGATIPISMGKIMDQTLAQNEYWILGTNQTRKGKTEDTVCESVQLSNWVAAQVAIKRRTQAATTH